MVVVTYNSEPTLAACLDALRPGVEAVGGEVVVVDNGSSDGSVAVARRLGGRVIATGRNLGFGAACNRAAAETSGDPLVFLNPDALLDPDALPHLVGACRPGERLGPVGGRARRADGSLDPRCTLGRPRLRGALAFALGLDLAFRGSSVLDPEHGAVGLTAGDDLRPVEAVSGALMAVPRTLWAALDGFDERFFLYGEDVDLCLRATALGWSPAVATAATYTHAGGFITDGTIQRRVLLYRGKVDLYRRHLSPAAAQAAVLGLQMGVLLRGLPARLPAGAAARRASPWWRLFQVRRQWRSGHGRMHGSPA